MGLDGKYRWYDRNFAKLCATGCKRYTANKGGLCKKCLDKQVKEKVKVSEGEVSH